MFEETKSSKLVVLWKTMLAFMTISTFIFICYSIYATYQQQKQIAQQMKQQAQQGQPEMVGIKVNVPKGADLKTFIKETLMQTQKGPVSIEHEIFPMKIKINCSAEKSCDFKINDLKSFPESDVKCNCREDAYLVKINRH